jgi:hypothetical protein
MELIKLSAMRGEGSGSPHSQIMKLDLPFVDLKLGGSATYLSRSCRIETALAGKKTRRIPDRSQTWANGWQCWRGWMEDYTCLTIYLVIEHNGSKSCFSGGWYSQGTGYLGKTEEDLCWRWEPHEGVPDPAWNRGGNAWWYVYSGLLHGAGVSVRVIYNQSCDDYT